MYGIGIGQSDFKILRIKKNYYIDKTKYIKDIIDNESSVVLIIRPRRFGKTLNMSMLRYYFDCTKKDSRELFEGLEIMKQDEKYTSKLGYYPLVMFLVALSLVHNFVIQHLLVSNIYMDNILILMCTFRLVSLFLALQIILYCLFLCSQNIKNKKRLLYRQKKIYKRHNRQQKQSTINNTTKKIRKNIKYEYVKILFWLHKKRQ